MINNKGHVLSFDSESIQENSQIESVKYNKIITSLKTSVIRCINRTRELSTTVNKLNSVLAAENRYLTANYNTSTYINNKYPADSKTALITGYDSIIEKNGVIQDRLTGNIYIEPITTFSKTPRYNDSNGLQKPSKDVYIAFGETDSIEAQTQGTDIYNALDGLNNTFWVYDSAVERTEYHMRIQYPVSLKPNINYIKILPFPAFGFDLTSVIVRLSNGSSVDIVDTIDKKQGIINTYFKTLSWGGILDIKFKANGDIFGLSNIDIGYSDFSDSYGSFVMDIPLLKNKSFSSISKLDLFDFGLNNISSENDVQFIKSNNINVKIYQGSTWDTATDETIIDKNTMLGISSTPFNKLVDTNFYIKFEFKKYLNQTPIFRGVSITYED